MIIFITVEIHDLIGVTLLLQVFLGGINNVIASGQGVVPFLFLLEPFLLILLVFFLFF